MEQALLIVSAHPADERQALQREALRGVAVAEFVGPAKEVFGGGGVSIADAVEAAANEDQRAVGVHGQRAFTGKRRLILLSCGTEGIGEQGERDRIEVRTLEATVDHLEGELPAGAIERSP